MKGMAKTLQIEYDEALLKLLGLSEEEFDREARFWIAAMAYNQRGISSGKAAALCGMGRVEFLLELARVGIPASNMTPDDLAEETPIAGT